jgi:hypothetical protein
MVFGKYPTVGDYRIPVNWVFQSREEDGKERGGTLQNDLMQATA